MILSLFLAIIIAIIGIFLISDCDLFLQYAPYDEKNAFENQIVWILGASSGIGAYLAIDLTKAGAQVIISARRENLLHEVAENCTKYGKTPMIVPIDILDYDSHEIAYNEIISKYGRIDSLVLNSGRSQRAVALETTLSVTKDIMELNFLSFVAITKLVVPDMVKAKKGQVKTKYHLYLYLYSNQSHKLSLTKLYFLDVQHKQVIVVSSLAGKLGNPISSSYAASKHALVR
jgi:dehydrogenase/reductase SDR family protein 7